MEELLRKLSIKSPPENLRERVVSTARAEMEQAVRKRDWVDRVWASRTFWYSSAAAILISLAANLLSPDNAPRHQAQGAPPDPGAVALAREIAHTLGDGPALEQRLVAQFSGPSSSPNDRGISTAELLRSLQ